VLRAGFRLAPAALAAGAVLAPLAAAYPGLHVVYAPREGAQAIHDGAPGLPGLTGSLRQGPVFDDPRWPASRQVAKVRGRALSRMDVPAMVATLRAGLADPLRERGVAIEELVAADWGVAATQRLIQALEQLGPAARDVFVWVGPSIVAQIGRVDLQDPLRTRHRWYIGALRRAGAILLEMYGGGAAPLTAAQFAEYPSRWLARLPAGEHGRLHVVFGPDRGVGQDRLWAWARSTPGGRQVLRNGAGVYGMQTAADGLEWLAQLRAFQSAPDTAPAGERPVPTRGGLTVLRSGRTVRVTLARPGRVTVSLIPIGGKGKRRMIRALQGPVSDVAVRLPRDLRPGRYAIITVARGNGLRDFSNIHLVVPRFRPVTPLDLTRRGRTLFVTVGDGNRVMIRLDPPDGRKRVIARLRGPLARRVVRIPRDLVKGVHIAVALSTGAGGRQQDRVGFRVR